MGQKTLLSSAKEFLTEALKNYNDRRRSFAIVHAVTATELVLKERLARIHPVLILKNIDTKDARKEQTVSLSLLPQRLANLGVQLGAKEARLVETFADWRNQIVHHMPAYDERAADRQLPQLLDFLAAFLRKELDTPLESFLPKGLYKVAARLLEDWQEVLQVAAARARAEGTVLSDPCPQCGSSGVMCARDDDRVYCHLCDTRFYRYDHCEGCGRETLSQYSPLATGNYCDACIADAGDRYIQTLIDIERGK